MSAACCAALAGAPLSKADIVKLVKHETHKICHSGSHREYVKVGCDYDAMFINGNWSVLVSADYRNAKGERLGLMGAETLYIYSPDGGLLRVLPGM